MEKQKIIVVVGPTAAGKTALGIKLAEHFNGEVVSADSMQVYKNMPIASAAVTKEEMGDIPHHLVGILEPTEKFSVAEFIKLAEINGKAVKIGYLENPFVLVIISVNCSADLKFFAE